MVITAAYAAQQCAAELTSKLDDNRAASYNPTTIPHNHPNKQHPSLHPLPQPKHTHTYTLP